MELIGWEGLFGLVFVAMLILPLNFIHCPDTMSYGQFDKFCDGEVWENTPRYFKTIWENKILIFYISGQSLCTLFYYLCGVQVTNTKFTPLIKAILDIIKILVVWLVSMLALKWEEFDWL